MVPEQYIQPFEQSRASFLEPATVSFRLRELQLKSQPMLAEKRQPVIRPGVDLFRAADCVVAMPAESLREHAMLMSELGAEQRLLFNRGARQLHPLEREERSVPFRARTEHRGHAHRIARVELAQSIRLRLQHGQVMRASDLHEHRPVGALPTKAIVDAATVYAQRRMRLEGAAQRL